MIQAGWTPASLDTTWHIGNTRVLWRSSACSNTAGRSPPEDDNEGTASLRVYGCQGGSSVVQLKVRNTGQVLGVVTITVNCVTNCGGDPPPGGGNPPPPQPTGWIEASPSKIVVGQTTTITAGWSNLDQDPNIVPSSTSLAPSCGGATGKSIIGPQQTQVMTGCSAGTIAVTLRNAANNKILASVTVKVYPKPLITSHSRIGYKYFKIGWLAKSDFTTFHVEWRHHGTTVPFVRLPGQASETSRARAEINAQSTGAAIRGIIHKANYDIELQLVAVTASGLQATSPAFTVSRGPKPVAVGHLPDHTMRYDLATLPTVTPHSLLVSWLKAKVPSYATTWVNSVAATTTLYACGRDCSGNKDDETVEVKLDAGCRSYHNACVFRTRTSADDETVEMVPAHVRDRPSVDTRINFDRTMSFQTRPSSDNATYIWTSVKGLDGKRFGPADNFIEFVWIDRAVVHELGHTFGLRDRNLEEDYDGIMDGFDFKKDAEIKDHDKDALIAIYETHIVNEGW